MKRSYRVQLWADFVESASSPAQLRGRLLRLVRREGLGETNFNIEIDRVVKEKTSVALAEEKVLRGVKLEGELTKQRKHIKRKVAGRKPVSKQLKKTTKKFNGGKK